MNEPTSLEEALRRAVGAQPDPDQDPHNNRNTSTAAISSPETLRAALMALINDDGERQSHQAQAQELGRVLDQAAGRTPGGSLALNDDAGLAAMLGAPLTNDRTL